MAKNNTRRKFIQNSLLASGGIILAPNFISCKSDDGNIEAEIPDTSDYENKGFSYGVASFDPTSSSVIIWTRYNKAATIKWEVASDLNFTQKVRTGTVFTESLRDNTIAIELTELSSNQKLFYRFINETEKTISVTGETIILPLQANELTLAVCSCSNYQEGFFNVYDAITKSSADIVLHLGDYIYENGVSSEGESINRKHQPENELLTLTDYRTRYKQYRSDKMLQSLHQKKPFITIWDDHEIADNAYKDGANNHSENSEGSFTARKQSALQAYSEYLPFSRSSENNELAYRNLNLGGLVDLIVLDTRIIGRDESLRIDDFLNENGVDTNTYNQKVLDENRTMLGQTQFSWLQDQINNSNAKWLVFGQQVLMGKMLVPAELVQAFGTENQETVLLELFNIKSRIDQNDPSVTQEERNRVENVVPFNLDAWDGYPVEREKVYTALQGKEVIVLSGDSHNAWYNTLQDDQENAIGIELATTSVSSKGFDRITGTDFIKVKSFEAALKSFIKGLNYFDASQRGYMQVKFTNAAVNTDWVFVDNVLSETYNVIVGHTEEYSV